MHDNKQQIIDKSFEDFSYLENEDPWLFNKYLNAWEQRTGKVYVKSYPIDMSIPFVESCDASCLFCSYWGRRPRYMSEEEIERYRNVFKYLVYVGINPAGEPLRHPEFDKFIPKIKKMVDPRCWFYLVTNGTALHLKQRIILDHVDSLSISLNAATQTTHTAVMGIQKQFDTIVSSIKDLVQQRYAEQKKINIYVTYVVLKQNFHELKEFIRLCEKIGVDRIYFRTLATANSNNPIKPSENLNYCGSQPRLHPDFKKLKDEAVKAIENSDIDIVAEPNAWEEDISMPLESDSNIAQEPTNDWVTLKSDRFPLTCQYLYKYLIDPRLTNIQPVCVYMEHLTGYDPVILDLNNFDRVRNATAMMALRKAFQSGPRIPLICTRCNILEAFKYSDL